MIALARLLATPAVGPVTVLVLAWMASVAVATWYLAAEWVDARVQRTVAVGQVERDIADVALSVETKGLLHQAAWALLGVLAVMAPAAPPVTDPVRATVSVAFTATLLGVQLSTIAYARYRRAKRQAITRALRAAIPSNVAWYEPRPGGRRRGDPPADGRDQEGDA